MTRSGTIISSGIEYSEYPIPTLLIKAMSSEFAEKLLLKGAIRIRCLEYFRTWENNVLGDKNDGLGQYKLAGNIMNVSSANDVYAFCMALPDIAHDRLRIISAEGKYDTLLTITSPEALFQRIKIALINKYHNYRIHCGLVKYDRSQEISNNMKYHFNVFQKSTLFSEDREYRLSVVNCSSNRLEDKYIELNIGDCRDIASISFMDVPRL